MRGGPLTLMFSGNQALHQTRGDLDNPVNALVDSSSVSLGVLAGAQPAA